MHSHKLNYHFWTYRHQKNFEIKKKKNGTWTIFLLRIYSTHENMQIYKITGKSKKKYLSNPLSWQFSPTGALKFVLPYSAFLISCFESIFFGTAAWVWSPFFSLSYHFVIYSILICHLGSTWLIGYNTIRFALASITL